jgi:signal transduction histidine kinase
MPNRPHDDRPERRQTDDSLRVERDKTDRALADRRESEIDADVIVRRARDTADAVLGAARDLADVRTGDATPALAEDVIERARGLEDVAIRDERATADETLRQEREESVRKLAALLPLEREKTDRFLLTERCRSDADLERRDDFMGMVSHDLRNLLGGIVLNAEVLAASAPVGAEGTGSRERAIRIKRYTARMNRLIGDLVDIASIDAGRLSVNATTGDLGAVTAEAVDLFREAAGTKGVALELDVAPAPLAAELDHDRIIQVLANLLTNAIKFTAVGGRIRVRCHADTGEVRLSVSDDGVGIPETMLEAVFERFWQVGRNDRRGLGLGLYISRCIVEAHGGTIHVESTLGAGSTFHVHLPARGGVPL